MSSPRTRPPAQRHKTMTSNVRTHTEPHSRGFIKSMMRRHEMSDFDKGIVILSQPEKKTTQEEQDAEDTKARKRAMRNLVNSWQERLQLISVITTFFASTEAAMLVNTKPANDVERANTILQAANACLLGALIAHGYAAVLSFLGAFLLITYKLKEATREEMIVERIKPINSPLGGSAIEDVERDAIDRLQQRTLTNIDGQSTMHKSVNYNATTSALEQDRREDFNTLVLSSDPHIEQVTQFVSTVLSSRLLSRTHAICVFLTVVGSVLAIVGVLCYSWALLPHAVSIFASACLGLAVLAMVALFI